MTTAALILLCGLPASGKSALVRTLCRIWAASDDALDVRVVSVDSLLLKTPYSALEWHAARDRAFYVVQEALKCERKGKLLVLVDDTMFYRSMRRKFFNLAAEMSCAFCVLHVQCSLDVCLQRNATRASPLPVNVMHRADLRFEPPSGSQHYWERCIHVVDTNVVDVRKDQDCRTLADDLLSHWEAAVKRGVSHEEKERRQQTGAQTNQQMLHQLDLAMRAVISDRMHQLKEGSIHAELAECSKRIRQLRVEHLEKYKASVAKGYGTSNEEMEKALYSFVQEMRLDASESGSRD